MLAFITLAKAMTPQVTRDVGPIVNSFESAMDFRFSDFLMMNPSVF